MPWGLIVPKNGFLATGGNNARKESGTALGGLLGNLLDKWLLASK